MVTMIDGWLRRRPPDGETAQSEPREVAQLLGHLVFISDVVPGGRTYLQAIPRQFRGLEVDWARGAVRHVHGRWRADVARRRLLHCETTTLDTSLVTTMLPRSLIRACYNLVTALQYIHKCISLANDMHLCMHCNAVTRL